MRKEFTLECTGSSCKKKFTEIIDLPMLLESVVARMNGWVCPECGRQDVTLLSVTILDKEPKREE